MARRDRTFSDLARCPTCGGLNALDAKWCGQCNRRFAAASRPSAHPDGAERPSYVQALAGLLVGSEALPEGGMERVFRLNGDSPSWVCECGAENELASTGCLKCGRPFGDTVKEVVERVAAQNAEAAERAAVQTLGHAALAARAGPLALPLIAAAVLVAVLKAAARAVLRRAR